MPLACRLRTIVEDMAQVTPAAAAMAFGANHEQRPVGLSADGIALRLPKAGPACSAVVFMLGSIKFEIAPFAMEHARAFLVVKRR